MALHLTCSCCCRSTVENRRTTCASTPAAANVLPWFVRSHRRRNHSCCMLNMASACLEHAASDLATTSRIWEQNRLGATTSRSISCFRLCAIRCTVAVPSPHSQNTATNIPLSRTPGTAATCPSRHTNWTDGCARALDGQDTGRHRQQLHKHQSCSSATTQALNKKGSTKSRTVHLLGGHELTTRQLNSSHGMHSIS